MEEQLKNISVEDEGLIAGCVKNDRRAQRKLYEKYASRFFPLCVRYVSSREQAKDILQDGFITVFDKLHTYKGDGFFEGWMRRIFINTALMYIRRNDILKHTDEIDEVPIKVGGYESFDVVDSLDAKQIMQMIGEMPDGFRTVFNLFVFEGFSHSEISKELGITEGSSRSQLSRGRVWLQEKINNLSK